MAYTLSIDGGETFIKVEDMSDELVKATLYEIDMLSSCDDGVSELFEGITADNDRERLSAMLERGDIWFSEVNVEEESY